MSTAQVRIQATGKRKTSVARIILEPGDGTITCNGRPIDDVIAGVEGQFSVKARLNGGGISGQADALRHAVARALVEMDENLRPDLKREGFLTRDAREKERKKAGLKGARKRPQFSKR